MTTRFARLSDLLIQKKIKTIDQLDASAPGTVRDRIMQAEKKGIIKDADTLLEIRNVRNTIAHEYESINIKEMFLFVFRYSDLLIEVLKNAKDYSNKFYKLNSYNKYIFDDTKNTNFMDVIGSNSSFFNTEIFILQRHTYR